MSFSIIKGLFGWKLYLSIALIALASFIIWHNSAISEAKETARQEVIAEYTIKLDKANQIVQDTINQSTIELRNKTSEIEKEKRDEILNLNRKYNATIAGLWERITRQEGNSNSRNTSDSESTAACNGTQLYREDAEFLAREARLADEIRIELASCYKQYDSVKEELDSLRLDYNLEKNN